jgi:hypothetical protein
MGGTAKSLEWSRPIPRLIRRQHLSAAAQEGRNIDAEKETPMSADRYLIMYNPETIYDVDRVGLDKFLSQEAKDQERGENPHEFMEKLPTDLNSWPNRGIAILKYEMVVPKKVQVCTRFEI